ncbi:hypothetical protein DSO57_1019954 [Entomophthora muscae]|uniref:Uncharacterized protein n=1 Tax=Entomophthora muscae TaxID=34485 RepID=A0ACC2TQT6_9FUNG|nr:hypothetical protein DSO57_1019954 [Entomophthora muscae]
MVIIVNLRNELILVIALSTVLMVCQTWVKHNTGNSSHEPVYGHKPAIVSTNLGPWLPLPKQVPADNDPDVQHARKDQETKEKERVEREIILIQPEQFQVRDKIWIVNHNLHKVKPGLKVSGIVMEVNPNNTCLIKGIDARTSLKQMLHD